MDAIRFAPACASEHFFLATSAKVSSHSGAETFWRFAFQSSPMMAATNPIASSVAASCSSSLRLFTFATSSGPNSVAHWLNLKASFTRSRSVSPKYSEASMQRGVTLGGIAPSVSQVTVDLFICQRREMLLPVSNSTAAVIEEPLPSPSRISPLVRL